MKKGENKRREKIPQFFSERGKSGYKRVTLEKLQKSYRRGKVSKNEIRYIKNCLHIEKQLNFEKSRKKVHLCESRKPLPTNDLRHCPPWHGTCSPMQEPCQLNWQAKFVPKRGWDLRFVNYIVSLGAERRQKKADPGGPTNRSTKRAMLTPVSLAPLGITGPGCKRLHLDELRPCRADP